MSTLQWSQKHFFHPESFSKEANILLKDLSPTALTRLLGRGRLAIQLGHNLSITNDTQAHQSPFFISFA